MLPFATGLTIGIWIGTYYNCKPTIEHIQKYIKENMPKQKTDKQD